MTMPPWQDYNIIKRIKLKYNNKGIITTTYTNFRFFVFLCLTVSRSTSSWELVYQFRLTYCERTHTWDSKMAKRKQSVKKKEKFWSNCWTGCNLNYFWEMDLLVRCSVFHLFRILLQWRWFYSRESLTKGQPVPQKSNESLQLKQLVYRYFVTEQFVETINNINLTLSTKCEGLHICGFGWCKSDIFVVSTGGQVLWCPPSQWVNTLLQRSTGSVLDFIYRQMTLSRWIAYAEHKSELLNVSGSVTDSQIIFKKLYAMKQESGENMQMLAERILKVAGQCFQQSNLNSPQIQDQIINYFLTLCTIRQLRQNCCVNVSELQKKRHESGY